MDILALKNTVSEILKIHWIDSTVDREMSL